MTLDKNSPHKLRSIIGYSLPFILTIAFLYLAFLNVDLELLVDIIAHLNILWLLVFILFFILSHIVRALRWKVILQSVNPETSIFNLFGATMVGYGVNFVVPRLGEFYRAFFGGRWENISRSSMLGTIIIERVIDVLILGFSVLVSVSIYSGNLLEEVLWLKTTLILGFAGITIITILLFLLIKLKESFVDVVVRFVNKISVRLGERLQYILNMLIEGFSSLKGFRNYIITIFYSVLIMLLYGFTAYLAFFILGMQESHDVTFAMAWIVMTISAFGIVIPTPGGTGSYHLISKTVLVSLYGFSEEVGLAYAFVTHTVSSVIFILSTIFFISIINLRRHKLGLKKENFLSVIKLNKGDK